MTQTSKKMSRRDALKILGAAAGASVLANLPSHWSTPQLASGVLPAHAQTSTLLPVVETIAVVSLLSSPIGFTVSSVRPQGNSVLLPPNWEFRGKVTADGGQPVSTNGFVYSALNSSPELGAADTTNVIGTPNPAAVGNEFSAEVYLPDGPQYHVRAYATNAGGTGYGVVLTFTASAA